MYFKEYIYCNTIQFIRECKQNICIKTHLLWNTFYVILNNIRSRLLHVSTETRISSLQVVPCCYCTSAVTRTVALFVLWKIRNIL